LAWALHEAREAECMCGRLDAGVCLNVRALALPINEARL
jgi:hypothetical protein